MKDDKALIEELKSERKALVFALKQEREKLAEANARADEAERIALLKSKKLTDRERRVAALENEAQTRYALDLKQLKLFSDRIRRLSESGGTILEKSRLTELFKDFFAETDKTSAREIAKKASDALSSGEEGDSELDDILSPKSDLDLRKLCEELGVYKGE